MAKLRYCLRTEPTANARSSRSTRHPNCLSSSASWANNACSGTVGCRSIDVVLRVGGNKAMSHLVIRCMLSLCVALLGGCYSIVNIRLKQSVHAGETTKVVGVWIRAPGPTWSDPPIPVLDAIAPLVFYPLDVVFDLVTACKAPFDPNIEIRGGPIGALTAIALPWITLIPYFYGPLPLPDVELQPEALAELIERIRRGDGSAAWRQIMGYYPWRGGEAALIAVEVIDPDRRSGDDRRP
jgi:hypothetical protein